MNHQVFFLILSQIACIMSYECCLKYASKENKKDDTIYEHYCYFQLINSITKTQIRCKLHWSTGLEFQGGMAGFAPKI